MPPLGSFFPLHHIISKNMAMFFLEGVVVTICYMSTATLSVSDGFQLGTSSSEQISESAPVE